MSVFKAPIGRETEMSFVVVQLCDMSVFLEVSCFCLHRYMTRAVLSNVSVATCLNKTLARIGI